MQKDNGDGNLNVKNCFPLGNILSPSFVVVEQWEFLKQKKEM
jgi:hypothetical protein